VERLVEQVVARPARAAIVVADAADSARLVKALREQGYAGAIFVGSWLGRRRFVEEAGAAAVGVRFPLLVEQGAAWRAFVTAYEQRCARQPDYAAGAAYDSTRLLMAAIRKAGLNRARIRDALEALSPWEGVTGWGRSAPAASAQSSTTLRVVESRRGWAIIGMQPQE
jgi:branched-chain amino acid transport system substrate-binding protein